MQSNADKMPGFDFDHGIGPSNLDPTWAEEVVKYLKPNLPRDEHGYDHMFCTAYEVGCQAFAKLGQATETERGASAVPDPKLPEILPRWDDLCTAVLYLAHQQGQITYLDAVDLLPPDVGQADRDRRHCVISAVKGFGKAVADRELMPVLKSMGLVADGQWAPLAETILWREAPKGWRTDFEADPRFINAADVASRSIPDEVRRKIDDLLLISTEQLNHWIARSSEQYHDALSKHGPNAKISKPDTMDQALRRHQFARRHALDWLFFSGWRFGTGWLDGAEAARALDIFHDPLAMSMRAAVMKRAYPEAEWAAI